MRNEHRTVIGVLIGAMLIAAGAAAVPHGQVKPPTTAAPFFTTPLPPADLRNKEAVVETTAGTFVIQLLAHAAPNHVGYFIKLAREGAYDGTTFHRVVKYGIIQGGDPISKDPDKRALYGTGGLGILKAEPNPEKHTRGAISGVILPGRPDTGGSQFFVCVVDQPGLDGQYTVFGRVTDGMEVVEKISEAAVDAAGKVIDRLEIRSVVVRDIPPPEPQPFSTESAEELAAYRAVISTSLGAVTVEFLPAKAPGHVRNFLRLAQAGVYDGTSFHRVVQGFVIQGGLVSTRVAPLSSRQKRLVRTLAPEFNDTPHVKGTLSMAHADDPASASTSFFMCTAAAPSLDGKYTAFGRVVDGMAVVEAIERVPVNGEAPVSRVEVTGIKVKRVPR
jgi:peptidyl-prolyl cis-trans isomerase B (cyclophilin B)